MIKYNIVHNERGQIICKNGGRHYRQPIGHIEKGLVPVATTKGRAEKEVAYLNANYYGGWETQEYKGENNG